MQVFQVIYFIFIVVYCIIQEYKYNYTLKLKTGVLNMLKNIPSVLSPELLKTLMEMGHG